MPASESQQNQNPDQLGADAAELFAEDELTRRFIPVFTRIAEGAVEREQNRELPYAPVEWLREAGYTRLRVPKQYGGEGVTFTAFLALVTRLGEADSNLPQILRVHGGFIEALLESSDEPLRDRWFTRIAQGQIIGGAVSERTGTTSNSVRLTQTDGAWYLDGEKYYTTGTLYADWVDVTAHDGQSDVRVLVRSDTPGLSRIDDWDGFGQRLTGSGTARFEHVPVSLDNLYRRYSAAEPRRNSLLTAYYQALHIANLAGISRAALRDAVTFTQARTRTFGVPGESSPRDNPLVHRVVGRLASLAYSTQSISASLARSIDAVSVARQEGRADEQTYIRLDIQTFQAQQIVIEQTLQAATLLFEVGGASATSETRRFDRYWRNARVLASHNPAITREAAIGDFYLNGKAHQESFGVARNPEAATAAAQL
ncbi:acyl-CoA dehydrogenase family protein [Paraburkholderia fungorum]|uniref:acyl-CoA dehydrogenase family protein n=1 Tax=Paraburkholderia fungorum TaxID=134537 RepID=UPI002092076E|nr:acyl-CoA dehydrogenase family protein [Paraburkholderia fungorum]USU20143.1 acyl-CoA dehydrogenase family protein [Paraburkholderia fungorum]USU27860.1 acyl-CoA dehydrogenase family protein [Paraburkholderia fungorum]